MSADMTDWDSQIVLRFKTLLNVASISGDIGEEGTAGADDEAKLKRVALARNRSPGDVRAAHEVLAALAFDGYQDWYAYDDDTWTTNCLGQVLDDDQNTLLLPALREADLIDLGNVVQKMAGPYSDTWRQAAESGTGPSENTDSWKVSRTPGTRYYLYRDGGFLYSDDSGAPATKWVTAEVREEEAAARATEWETGSGLFYTTYENPALVGNVEYVFGQSKYGPWILDRSEAESLLANLDEQDQELDQLDQELDRGIVEGVGQASSIEPYFDTGHFTKYENDTYCFGATADARDWYLSYADLLDALAPLTVVTVPQPEEIVRPVLQGTQDEVGDMRKSWSELEKVLASPVTMKSLVKQPEAIKMLGTALQEVQSRLAKVGIIDLATLRSGQVTVEVKAVIDDMKKQYPNEVFRHGMVAVSAKIVDRIKENPTPNVYKQRGFDLEVARSDTDYQADFVRKLLADAPLAQAELTKIAKEYAEKYGGEASWRETPKDFDRAMAKVGEYQGDASMLVDVVGARVRFPRLTSVYKALDDLQADSRLEIVRIKDRIAEATPSGNRSILMNVQVKDQWGGGGEGQIAELKFGLTAYDEIAAVDHPLYEIRRDMEDVARREGRSPTPAELLIKASTEVQGRQKSDLVWNRMTAGNDLTERLVDHPDVAVLGELLLTDSAKHPTNIASRLADPKTREVTIRHISELAEASQLKNPGLPKNLWRPLFDYSLTNPGRGPLFQPVDPSVNKTIDGQDRAAEFQRLAKQQDPVRNVGSPASATDLEQLTEYADWLRDVVEPAVQSEVRQLAQSIEGAEVNVRTKSAAGILDKVERMTTNLPGRPARPDYRAGDVIDAVGARITTPDMRGLAQILERVQEHFGVGDEGRILELDNMYAAPKSKNPGYRVIPLVIRGQDSYGRAYTFELQLTTLRASIAADIEHNTLFKPYISLTSVPVSDTGGFSSPEETIRWIMYEAAALDQRETS